MCSCSIDNGILFDINVLSYRTDVFIATGKWQAFLFQIFMVFFLCLNFRQDRTKQDLVYKLIPGLKESNTVYISLACYPY